MNYLYQRPSGYYFRIKIPLDLRPIIRFKEIKRSLKTGHLSLAKERAFLISGRLKKFFRILKGQKLKLTKEKISDIIDQYIQEGLENIDEYILPKRPISTEQMANSIEGNEDLRSILVEDMVHYNYDVVDETATKTLKEQGLEADKDSYEYRKLCHDMLKARVGLQDVEMAKLNGNYAVQFPYKDMGLTEPPATPIKKSDDPIQNKHTGITTAQSEKITPNSPPISKLLKAWFDENIKADLWKPRTLKQYTGYFTIISQIIGADKPILSIDHSTVRNLKETLLKLPPGMNNKKTFQGKTIPEIIQITESEGIQTLNVNTINGYIIALGAFFKWCVGNGHTERNYAEGMKIKVNRNKRPDEIRSAFSTEDLKQIFNSPAYIEDTFKESYHFWLPILGLYTGARINEICQLRLKDIQEVNGISSLIFQEDSNDKEVSIKNTASMRTIPLHPVIAKDLNFMDHVQKMRNKGEERLFPELPYQNFNYGHKATKWFGTYKRKCGIVSPKLVFHSFRHTLSDNLKQQLITETLIDELTGHALQGETMGRYGKRYTIEVLYNEAVLKLDYKINLDHLKDSKWVTGG